MRKGWGRGLQGRGKGRDMGFRWDMGAGEERVIVNDPIIEVVLCNLPIKILKR